MFDNCNVGFGSCEWDSETSTCYSCNDLTDCNDYTSLEQCVSDICSVNPPNGCDWNYGTEICEVSLPQLGFFERIIEGIKDFFKWMF